MFGTSMICKTWYPDADRARGLYAESLDSVASAARDVERTVERLYAYANDSLLSGEVISGGTTIFDKEAVTGAALVFDPKTAHVRKDFRWRLARDLERLKNEYAKTCIIRDWLNSDKERNALKSKIVELQDKLFDKQCNLAAALVDKDIVNLNTVFNKMCEEANK